MLRTLIFLMLVLMTCEANSQINAPSSGNEVCEKKECVITAARILESLDESADPCEDFYQFACGGWVDETILLPHQNRIVYFAREDIRIAALRNLLASEHDPSDLDVVKKAKDMYSSCIDYASRSTQDTDIIEIITNNFGSWPLVDDNWNEDNFDLENFLRKAVHLGVHPLIQIDVYLNKFFHNTLITGTHVLSLKPPSFTLPSGEYWGNKLNNLALQAFEKKIYSDAERFGLNDPERGKRDTIEIIEVETKLVEIYNTFKGEKKENLNIAELESSFGQQSLINWTHFVINITSSPKIGITDIIEQEKVWVISPSYLRNVTEYFSQLPNRVTGNIKNSKEFNEAFKCPTRANMNPASKCQVW